MCHTGLQFPAVVASEHHHSAPTLEDQWVPPSAVLGSWTTWDINGLLGR